MSLELFINSGSFDYINITNVDITSASMESLFVDGDVNVTGSLIVNNQSVVVSKTKYGKLAFSKFINGEQSYYTAPMDVNPPFASFKFPTNPRDWTQSVNRITMDTFNAVLITGDPEYGGTRYGYCPDDTLDMWINYTNKMFEIINKGLTNSIITLTSVDWPNTFKQFKITGGTYYINNYDGLGNSARINWGDNFTNWTTVTWDNLPPNNKLVPDPAFPEYVSQFDSSQYQQENGFMWPDYYNYSSDNLIIPTAYFDIDVTEIASNYEWYTLETDLQSGVGYYVQELPTVEPNNGDGDEGANDLFWVDFDVASPDKRKEVVVIDSSTEWVMPSWADKVTAYVISGAGGGGGGTAGYKHYSGLPIVYGNAYTNTGDLVKSFGHEFMSGGGGGAGGNVAVKTFSKADIPAGSILSVLIGTGGVGGDGYGFADDTNTAEDTIRFFIDINNPAPDLFPDINQYPDEFQVFSNFLKRPKGAKYFHEPGSTKHLGYAYFYRLNKYKNKNDGKRGSPSSIILKSTPTNANVMQQLMQVRGGTGGRSGLGIRSFYTTSHLLNRMILNADGTVNQTGGIKLNQYFKISQYWVPGGGSTIGNSAGYDIIYAGSPGGYGITMGTVMHDYDLVITMDGSIPTRQDYALIVDKNLKRNTAPPQTWDENINLPDLKLPYGDTGVNRTDSETSKKPDYPSPTGGGGGAGKCMVAMENRLISEEGYIDIKYISTNDPTIPEIEYNPSLSFLQDETDRYGVGFPNNEVPDDYFRDLAIKMNQATTLGLGGDFISSNILVNETDSNGVNWVIKLGKGGDGGYDVSENPHAAVAGYTSNILPQNGSGDSVDGFGGGGGGGASKYTQNIHYDGGDISIVGQNGADGGNGVVVLVIES